MHDSMNSNVPPTQPGGMPRKLVKRRAAQSKKIGCPQCAAPIEIRNYAMAEQVTCSFCGGVVDLTGEDKKVVRQILIKERPKAQLDLGMKGRLKGKPYEVIGRIRLKGFEDGESFFWDEYLLFNPNCGYAWLQEDEGRWTFFQKMRNKPVIDPRSVMVGYSFVASGQTYVVSERTDAAVDYVEGEFTYHVQKGDKVGNLDCRSPCGHHECSAEWTANELEWLIGTNLAKASICKAFGLETPPEVLQASSHEDKSSSDFYGFSVAAWAIMFALLTGLLIVITYSVYHGEVIASADVPASKYLKGQGPFVSEPFGVVGPTIVEVEYEAFVDNSWVFFETRLLNKQKKVVNAWANNISYYHSGSWSEGSRHSRTFFHLPESGKYYISISGGEGGSGYRGTTPRKETISYTVKTDVAMARYFAVILAFYCFVLFLTLCFPKMF